MPDDVVVKDVWSVLRLVEGVSRCIIIAFQDVRMRPGPGIVLVHILKNIVVNIVAPLADALICVANYAVPHMIEGWKSSPRTGAGARILPVYYNVVHRLKAIESAADDDAWLRIAGVTCCCRGCPPVRVDILNERHASWRSISGLTAIPIAVKHHVGAICRRVSRFV